MSDKDTSVTPYELSCLRAASSIKNGRMGDGLYVERASPEYATVLDLSRRGLLEYVNAAVPAWVPPPGAAKPAHPAFGRLGRGWFLSKKGEKLVEKYRDKSAEVRKQERIAELLRELKELL